MQTLVFFSNGVIGVPMINVDASAGKRRAVLKIRKSPVWKYKTQQFRETCFRIIISGQGKRSLSRKRQLLRRFITLTDGEKGSDSDMTGSKLNGPKFVSNVSNLIPIFSYLHSRSSLGGNSYWCSGCSICMSRMCSS